MDRKIGIASWSIFSIDFKEYVNCASSYIPFYAFILIYGMHTTLYINMYADFNYLKWWCSFSSYEAEYLQKM